MVKGAGEKLSQQQEGEVLPQMRLDGGGARWGEGVQHADNTESRLQSRMATWSTTNTKKEKRK